MNITKTNFLNVNGTSFFDQTILFTLNDLIKAFGEPDLEDGEAVNCSWKLQTNNGLIFTIYDWYEPMNPNQFPNDYFQWHIGSFRELDLDELIEIRTFIQSKILK